MIVSCGPKSDKRTLTLDLPTESSKIGIFVSGGLDSAILYYLLMEENKRQNNIHEIVPLTVLRKEGSKNFAQLVVAHVQSAFHYSYSESLKVGDNTLPEPEQVKSGVQDAFKLGFKRVYTGLIEQLPEHMIGWDKIPYNENDFFKAPMKDLNKSHVVDLCFQFKQEALFYITHSCAAWEVSRCYSCNGCNERRWGFEQLGLVDPGTI
jgi:hypothetical protein